MVDRRREPCNLTVCSNSYCENSDLNHILSENKEYSWSVCSNSWGVSKISKGLNLMHIGFFFFVVDIFRILISHFLLLVFSPLSFSFVFYLYLYLITFVKTNKTFSTYSKLDLFRSPLKGNKVVNKLSRAKY